MSGENKKKFYYIINSRLPSEKANAIQTIKTCERLAKFFDLTLLAPFRFRSPEMKNVEDIYDYYEIENNFQIKIVPVLDIMFIEKYLPGFFSYIPYWVRTINYSVFLFFYLLFKKNIIIYSRDEFPTILLSFFKKNIYFEAHKFPQKGVWFYKWLMQKFKGIICISQQLKNKILNLGYQEKNILVSPDGVDLNKFDILENVEQCRKKLNLPLDKKIILYTGHLYEWKGADILAQASQYLEKNAIIYFVGGTQKDVESFKIRNSKFKINVIGHKSYKKVPYWLKAADVLVLPNSGKYKISKYYTSPLKLFEYMAAKKPIIASNLPSLKEILTDHKNSILFEPDNASDLAKKIKFILNDPDLAEKITVQAHQDVKKYEWKNRANIITEFILNS